LKLPQITKIKEIEMESKNKPLACDMNSKIDPRDAPWTHFGWQNHGVVRLNGAEAVQTLAAQLYFIGGEWGKAF